MWIKIRMLGELQLLTRASYVMLFIVPILASLWPAVRVVMNSYNNTITDSRAALDFASQRLEHAATSFTGKADVSASVNQILSSLNDGLVTIIQNHSLQVIDNVRLPPVWAFAFLAAISVTIGHLLYQAFAPSLVRRSTIREYVNDEVRQFVESPSSGKLMRAKHFAGKEEHPKKPIPGIRIPPMPSMGKQTEQERREEITHIENGAIGEYCKYANQAQSAAIISAAFYLIGLILIAWITLTQTLNVIYATWG